MPSNAADVAAKINGKTAARLAAQGYGWNLKYMDYDREERSFFVFAALGGQYGTAPVGWLGVNRWTGDVWDVWNCRRLSTAALRKSQASIHQRFRRDERRQYARLRALKPVCDGP